MERYIDLALRQGLSGADALLFAEKQIEKEERKREREREEQREEDARQRKHEIEIEKIRREASARGNLVRDQGIRAAAKGPKIPTFEDGKDNMDS